VKINTARFGEVEIPDDKLINFPRGILGFDHLKKYFLMDYKDTDIKWLQSAEDPEVAFMVADPFPFFPGYQPEMSPVEKKLLDIRDPADVAVLAIMNVSRNGEPMVTLNLQAPLVFNAEKMTGFQVVMEKSKFGVKEAVSV